MGAYQNYLQADRSARRLRETTLVMQKSANRLPSRDANSLAAQVSAKAGTVAANRDARWKLYQATRQSLRKSGWTIFGVALTGWLIAGGSDWGDSAGWGFLLEMALAFVGLIGLGLAVQGRALGAAIDSRNRVSLSKLQMLAWTVLAVSALAVLCGAWLQVNGVSTPLDPPKAALKATPAAVTPPVAQVPRTGGKTAASAPKTSGSASASNAATPANAISLPTPGTDSTLIPASLLLAMGIAATSFVATPLLLSLKADQEPTAQDKADLVAHRGTDLANQGKVDGRNDPAEASLSDIFHGDEVGNASDLDVSKIQQIFITVLLLALYGGAIFKGLGEMHGLMRALPDMNTDFIRLLAISHASYLGYKAAPKTATGP